jgi:hypothetical protein
MPTASFTVAVKAVTASVGSRLKARIEQQEMSR